MKNLSFVSILASIATLIIGGLFISNIALASNPTLISKQFTVWNQGGVIGYDAGFILSSDETLVGAQSVVIKLYSGSTLLQTNTAIKGKLTGNEFITPFNVFGTFNYTNDGYFTNTREGEYGQTLAPTKVIATITLADGKTVTTTNTHLTGDTNTIGVTSVLGEVLGVESFKFTQSMKEGSKGNEVMELQKFLNNAGYDCGTADGIFGKITKFAVIKLQVANELKGDGIIGEITRGILNK